MKYLFGGDDVESRVGGSPQLVRAGTIVAVYTDSAGTVVATGLRDAQGNPITSVVVDSYSKISQFYLEADDQDTVYVRVAGGPLTAIRADVDTRLDLLATDNAAYVDQQIATVTTPAQAQALIDTAINQLINGAPGALNTLYELATALQSDESAIAAINTALANRAPLVGGVVPDANLPARLSVSALTGYEAKVSRTGAATGQVPMLQADGSLAFGSVAAGGSGGGSASAVAETLSITWAASGLNTWTSKASFTTARQGIAGAVVNGLIYGIGGAAAAVSAVNEMYDPVADVWTTKAPMPTARNNAEAGVVNGIVYVIGGYSGGYLTVNEAYDPVANTWSTKAPMPSARHNMAVGVVGGKVYVIGGENPSAYSSVNEVYDPVANTWATKAALPHSRSASAYAVQDGIIYVIGGAGDLTGYNEAYDPVANTWTTKTNQPTLRQYAIAGAAPDGRIYVIGGMDINSNRVAVNEAYDPLSNTWSAPGEATPLPAARNDMGVGVVNGKIYVFGGTVAGVKQSTTLVYDPGVATLNPVKVPATPMMIGTTTSGLTLRNRDTGISAAMVAARAGDRIYPVGTTIDNRTATTISIVRIGG